MRGYEPHKTLSDRAHPRSELWRLCAGMMLAFVLFILLALLYTQIIPGLLPAGAFGPKGRGLDAATTPWAVIVTLFIFAPMMAALGMAMTWLHGRPLSGLIGPPGVAWAQARRAGLAAAALYGVLYLLPFPAEMTPVPGVPLGPWLIFLPLSLIGLLIQVSAEELIFRGYLQSQLAARFRSPWVWIIVPSVLFGLLHYSPDMGGAAWWMVLWATLFGIVAADITARTGTLGPAIALHFVNNFTAIFIVATMDYFDGLALWRVPFDLSDTSALMMWMPVELLLLLCAWLTMRAALRV